MTFINFLKKQLSSFVDDYRLYCKKTINIAIIFTIVIFSISVILIHFSKFAPSVSTKQVSILSYFFIRYSKANTYSIIDLIKTVFIFFVAIYSVGLLRLLNLDNKKFTIQKFLKAIKLKDIFCLLLILVFSSGVDIILFKMDNYVAQNTEAKNVSIYIHSLCFNLRIYLPLMFFSLAIRALTNAVSLKLTFKSLLYLYISIWIFNEFAFEITIWVRTHIFALILMPFNNPDSYYLIESIIGVPLIALFFVGYFTAMTSSLRLWEHS